MRPIAIAAAVLIGCASHVREEGAEDISAADEMDSRSAGCLNPTSRLVCAGEAHTLTVEWNDARDICTACEADGQSGRGTGGYTCLAGATVLRLAGDRIGGYRAEIETRGDSSGEIPCSQAL